MTDNTKQTTLDSRITAVQDLGNGTFRVTREEILSAEGMAMQIGHMKTALEGTEWNGAAPTATSTQAAAQPAAAKSGTTKGAKNTKATAAKGAGRTRGTGTAAKTNARKAAGDTGKATAKGTSGKGGKTQTRTAARSTRSDDRVETPNLFTGTGADQASLPATAPAKGKGGTTAKARSGASAKGATKATGQGKAETVKATGSKAKGSKAGSATATAPQDPILAAAGRTKGSAAGDAGAAKAASGKGRTKASAAGKSATAEGTATGTGKASKGAAAKTGSAKAGTTKAAEAKTGTAKTAKTGKAAKGKAGTAKAAKGRAETAQASAAPVTKPRAGRRAPLPTIAPGTPTNSPTEVKEAAIRIMQKAGAPVPRRELYIALVNDGVIVPGNDPIENLATMLYKDTENRFRNEKGVGFSLRA